MDKMAEDIWKGVLSSIIVTAIILGGMRYYEGEGWWRINQIKDPDQFGPLIFYSIRGVGNNDTVSSKIFIKNVPQKISFGQYGSFENLYSGQSAVVEVNVNGQTIRSPSFIIKYREIKNLSFLYAEGEVKYQGSSERIRKFYPFRTVKLPPENNDVFSNYSPLGTAEAKEKE
jgi:hypothetical protein